MELLEETADRTEVEEGVVKKGAVVKGVCRSGV